MYFLNLKKFSLLVAIVLTSLLILGSNVHAEPEQTPEERLAELQLKVDELYHDAEIATEKYNELTEEKQKIENQLQVKHKELKDQERKVNEIKDVISGSVVDQYLNHSQLNFSTRLIASESPEDFLEQISVQQMTDTLMVDSLDEFELETQKLENQEYQIDQDLKEVQELHQASLEEKTAIETLYEEASLAVEELEKEIAEKEELRRLAEAQAVQQQHFQQTFTVNPPVVESERVQIVIDFLYQQLGKRYVWGGNGPDVWDCSGITKAAWSKAGINLPRVSRAQALVGTRISADQLQPGDLVFFYSPITHVGVYIGDGKMIHASNPRTGVLIAPIKQMPITAMTRVI